MYTKFILACLSFCMLHGCGESPISTLKSSANNRIIDFKGFKKGKRRPLYNSKYIAQAKKNIALDEECCEDEDEETELKVPSKVYRHMYMKMLSDEYRKKKDKLKYYSPEKDLSLTEAERKVSGLAVPTSSELQKEINEIKTLLKQTRSELVKYKCKPNAIESRSFKDFPNDFKDSSEEINLPREEVLKLQPSANALQKKFLPNHDNIAKQSSDSYHINETTVKIPTKDKPIISRPLIRPGDGI